MPKKNLRTFDAYLEQHFAENPDRIEGFLQTALEEYEKDPDEAALLMALRHVAKAKGGMTELAKKTNLSRESLYKTLSPTGNPRLRNLQRILETFGYSLSFKPLKSAR
jgi:probable addiction module antidote protein